MALLGVVLAILNFNCPTYIVLYLQLDWLVVNLERLYGDVWCGLSDDMLIKLWDWEKKWVCTQVFEGHTHYVMQIVINPKDNNTFASCSLDRTVKVCLSAVLLHMHAVHKMQSVGTDVTHSVV